MGSSRYVPAHFSPIVSLALILNGLFTMLQMDITRRRIFIQQIQHLPTLPTTMTKIMEVVDSPNPDVMDFVAILSRDPSTCSLILRLVNSAYYGNLRQVSSIEQAVSILGYQVVKTFALGVTVLKPVPEETPHFFDREQFWVHSIGVATLAKHIGDQIPGDDLDHDAVFLAGLIHDVGKVVFDNFFFDDYREVLRLVNEEHLFIREAESRVLGLDHTEAGYYLCRKWQLPRIVVEAVRCHHDPGKASSDVRIYPALVNAAEYCSRRLGLGHGGNLLPMPLDPQLEELGITRPMMDRAMDEVEPQRQQIEALVF